MATIEQVAPFNDTTVFYLSAAYSVQLQAEVGSSPDFPVWTTTEPSNVLSVSSTGFLTTTGELGVGIYVIEGTTADSSGNTGTWSFTLTVTASVTPQTSVTPGMPLAPTGLEISVPFSIDPTTGGVGVLSSYTDILAQHIKTIILTALGERVMLPKYGSGLETAVFGLTNDPNKALLQNDLKKAVAQWEPAVKVLNINISQTNDQPQVLTVNVEYAVIPFNDVNTLTIATGGTIQQVRAS